MFFSTIISLSITMACDATPRLPWHVADVFYDASNDIEFTSISIDLTCKSTINEAESRIFVVPLASKINNITFYFGISYRNNNVYSKTPVLLEKNCFRFTRFSNAKLDSAFRSKGGYSFISNHEGEHACVLLPDDIYDGKYTFTIKKNLKLSSLTLTVVDLEVLCHTDKSVKHVGGLGFDGNKLLLDKRICSFVELVGLKNKQDLNPVELKLLVCPDGKFEFANLMIDNNHIQFKQIVAGYNNNVPLFAKAKMVTTKNDLRDKNVVFDTSTDQLIIETSSTKYNKEDVFLKGTFTESNYNYVPLALPTR